MPVHRNHHRGADPRSAAVNARVSRRRALQLGGFAGLTGLLAACGSTTLPDARGSTSPGGTAADAPGAGTIDGHLASLLDAAPQCMLTEEETQGPYWFDVDDLRSDVREDRRGVPMHLALRVQQAGDGSRCTADPSAAAVPGAVVEIWQCDAMGVYSGFRNGSGGAGGPPPGPGGSSADGPTPRGGPAGFDASGAPLTGPTSDGGYSAGDVESVPSGEATFLRGAQVADADGVVRFTSIFPGWYSGRTVHVHIKVHRDRKTVLTTQLYFDDSLTDRVLTSGPPYSLRGPRDTRNATDPLFDPASLAAARRSGGAVLAALNVGL